MNRNPLENVEFNFSPALTDALVKMAEEHEVPLGDLFSQIIVSILTMDSSIVCILHNVGRIVMEMVDNDDSNEYDVEIALSIATDIAAEKSKQMMTELGYELSYNNVTDDGEHPSMWEN